MSEKTLAFKMSSLLSAKTKAQTSGKIVIAEEHSNPAQRFICRNLAQGKHNDYYALNTWRNADRTDAVFYCADSPADALAFIRAGRREAEENDANAS